MFGWISRALATTWTSIPGRWVNFTACRLNSRLYRGIRFGPARGIRHLRSLAGSVYFIEGSPAVSFKRLFYGFAVPTSLAVFPW